MTGWHCRDWIKVRSQLLFCTTIPRFIRTGFSNLIWSQKQGEANRHNLCSILLLRPTPVPNVSLSVVIKASYGPQYKTIQKLAQVCVCVCSAPGWWCLLVLLPSEDSSETGERGLLSKLQIWAAIWYHVWIVLYTRAENKITVTCMDGK